MLAACMISSSLPFVFLHSASGTNNVCSPRLHSSSERTWSSTNTSQCSLLVPLLSDNLVTNYIYTPPIFTQYPNLVSQILLVLAYIPPISMVLTACLNHHMLTSNLSVNLVSCLPASYLKCLCSTLNGAALTETWVKKLEKYFALHSCISDTVQLSVNIKPSRSQIFPCRLFIYF